MYISYIFSFDYFSIMIVVHIDLILLTGCCLSCLEVLW